MIHLRIAPDTSAAALAPAVSALHEGGVVVFPTETFYGVAVDPRSAPAVKRVFEIKRRPPDHPLPLIANDVDQVIDHVAIMTPLARRLAWRGWPGPLTLVIPASPRLCVDVHLSTGRIAVRVPANRVARLLFNLPVRDVDCDFRLIRKSVLQELGELSNSGAVCVELIRGLHTRGAVFAQVEVDHYPRRHGRSQFLTSARVVRTLYDFCGLWIKLVCWPKIFKSKQSQSIPPAKLPVTSR